MLSGAPTKFLQGAPKHVVTALESMDGWMDMESERERETGEGRERKIEKEREREEEERESERKIQ